MAALRSRLVVGAVAVVVLALVVWTWSSFYEVIETQRPFDRSEWLAAPHRDTSADPGCYRGGMALDVVRSARLIGKDAAYTESVLGPPEGRSPGVWHYSIGQCTGFGWHNTDLLIHFDSRFMVTKAEVRHVESVRSNPLFQPTAFGRG
jgi:hypothetical protein